MNPEIQEKLQKYMQEDGRYNLRAIKAEMPDLLAIARDFNQTMPIVPDHSRFGDIFGSYDDEGNHPVERTEAQQKEDAEMKSVAEDQKAQNEATIQAILAKGFLAATAEDWQTLKELGAADYDYDYSDPEGEAMPLKLKKGYTFQIPDTDLWASGD